MFIHIFSAKRRILPHRTIFFVCSKNLVCHIFVLQMRREKWATPKIINLKP